jgi:hypothetical protein
MYIFNWHDLSPWRHMKRCHGRLHYDRKFQIFIFLIGYINVNKGVFYLIISYLRIKSYNVLNYNNCSTDWSFPLLRWMLLHIIVIQGNIGQLLYTHMYIYILLFHCSVRMDFLDPKSHRWQSLREVLFEQNI